MPEVPMFALASETRNDGRLVTFGHATGLFSAASRGVYGQVSFRASRLEGAALAPEQGQSYELGSCSIQIVDIRDLVMGEYHLSDARLDEIVVRERFAEASVSGFATYVPLIGADIFWAEWRNAPPAVNDLWAPLSRQSREAWLEVVSFHGFASKGRPGRRPEDFILNGANVKDEAAFYCAIGEAINGPGGYFGWNLDALADCLRGGWGAEPGLTLHWHSSHVAREYLTRTVRSGAGSHTFFEVVGQIFRASGSQLILR
jgi:RNAse (barnase) inhibitor barstar